MKQVRLGLSIQVLNSFSAGILSVVLPLMMVERNIDVVTIGFVFAAMPMIFQLSRMAIGIISDFWGRRPFFFSNAVLGAISSSIYYLAQTPLEFLFGKIIEGTKSASLWAVNRAFLMEKSEKKWRILVHLRTTSYVSSAAGSLISGFLIAGFLYDGAIALCILVSVLVLPLSFLLAKEKRRELSVSEAIQALDFRRKGSEFKSFLLMFIVMGLAVGLLAGFVFPLFLLNSGFSTEEIGLLIGLQIFLAGVFSYIFAGRFRLRTIVLLSGALYGVVLILLGVSTPMFVGILVVSYGMVNGLLGIAQEGILSRITNAESYGTDIGLLMMGLHGGRTISIALTGFLISAYGFAAPFLLSAFILMFFSFVAYRVLGS